MDTTELPFSLSSITATPAAATLPPGDAASVGAYMIDNIAHNGPYQNAWKGVNGGVATITYQFATTADSKPLWSDAEKAAAEKAMATWAGIANVKFVRGTDVVDGTDPAPNGLLFTKNTSVKANETDNGNGTKDTVGTTTKATISIDTTTPTYVGDDGQTYKNTWTDLTTVGGYGYATLVHEIGHALGLGHPGGYNQGSDPKNPVPVPEGYLSGTVFTTDTKQYTIMSYNKASLTGANYDVTTDTTISGATPALYDIAAIGKVYGFNTQSAGGITYGFNSTAGILGYDFTQNKTPVVTIYASGTRNSLDLSGFSTTNLINLQAGSFSDVAGLAKNISIAYNTRVDRAVGGSGDDTFIVNKNGDVIDGAKGTNTVTFSANRADYTFLSTSIGAVIAKGADGTDSMVNIQKVQFADLAGPVSLADQVTASFDALRYEASNPDVARAFRLDTTAATRHFVQNGILENRSEDSFDPWRYLCANTDVLRVYGADPAAGARHYIVNGVDENRSTTAFDPSAYLRANPDVAAATGGNLMAAEQHYATYGFRENRNTGTSAVPQLAGAPSDPLGGLLYAS